MSGKYIGVVSCVLPMIKEMSDELTISRGSHLDAKVSRCSQLCATDDQGDG
jgi:hypothetical protein